MNEPMIEIERTRVNLWNILGMASVVVVQIIAGTVVYTNMQRDIAEIRTAQIEVKAKQAETCLVTDRNFEEVRSRLSPLGMLEYRLGQNEARDKAQDERIDRIASSFGEKLDGISDQVNAMRSDVRVLAQKVDTINGVAAEKAKPTSTLHVTP